MHGSLLRRHQAGTHAGGNQLTSMTVIHWQMLMGSHRLC